VTTDLYVVIGNPAVAPGIHRLSVGPSGGPAAANLQAPSVVQPGQFHMLKTLAPEPLLPRPISIHEVAGDVLSFLYEIKGAGTRNIAALAPGDPIRVTGPLGRGFGVDALTGRILLVAGGIGIAPFRYLARALVEAGRTQVTLAAGFRGLPYGIQDFQPFIPDVRIATEDGSAGVKGRVTALYDPRDFDVVVACGPVPMMRAVQQGCVEAGTRSVLSMEARMACGIGLCLGCTIRTTTGMRRVCTDGPVFPGEEVFFDAHA
jgi:dihydroorotate dehydrogenase electron transfer subunit